MTASGVEAGSGAWPAESRRSSHQFCPIRSSAAHPAARGSTRRTPSASRRPTRARPGLRAREGGATGCSGTAPSRSPRSAWGCRPEPWEPRRRWAGPGGPWPPPSGPPASAGAWPWRERTTSWTSWSMPCFSCAGIYNKASPGVNAPVEYTPSSRRRHMLQTKTQAKLLERERVSRVATVGDGMPHLVPVCHVVAGGKIYFGSGRRGRKVRNVRANPRLALTVDLYSDDWSHITGVMVQGRGRVIERGPRFRALRRRLYAKYPQYAREAALGESDSVIVELTPTHVFSW